MFWKVLPALLLVLPGQDRDTDLVRMKDGSTRRGFVVSESAGYVTLEVLVEGAKGEITGVMKVDIPSGEVADIERMPEAEREKARARAAWFADRRRRLAEALGRIKPEPARFMGRGALRTVGSHFEVWSTCEEGFVKKVTHDLELIYDAYQEFFSLKRRQPGRIKVYMLSDAAEFRDFGVDRLRARIDNPAFYHNKDNYIAAYNMVQKGEASQVRGDILRLEEEIEEVKRKLREMEGRLKEEARQMRQRIVDRAAEMKKSGASRAAVNRWKSDQLDLLKRQEKLANETLREYRRKADGVIAGNRKVIAHNNTVLFRQNQRMFETLYHEAFHAFVDNFLWEAPEGREVPRWLNEGMATYFEMSVAEQDELIHGAPHVLFMDFLRNGRRAGTLPRLSQVLRAGPEQFAVAAGGDAALSNGCYATSWLLVHYLTKHSTREKIEGYVEDVMLKGADPVKAFEKMTARRAHEAEADLWKHFDTIR